MGVTVMVPEIGVVPGFCAMKEGMLPVPLAASPIAGLLLVQERAQRSTRCSAQRAMFRELPPIPSHPLQTDVWAQPSM